MEYIFIKNREKLICTNCKNEYKISKLFSFFGIYYIWILLLIIYNESYLIKSKLDVLSLIMMYILVEFMIMITLPLKKVENNSNKSLTKIQKLIYYLLTIILSFVLIFSTLYLFMAILSEYYYTKYPVVLGEDDLGGSIFVFGNSLIGILIISPLLIFILIEIIKYITKKGINNGKK